MAVRLVPVDSTNWREVMRLELRPDQESFLHNPTFSLAEAYVRPEAEEYRPLAIYEDDLLVGFAMYAGNPSSRDVHWIARFMIDHRFQGRGYGRLGMELLLRMIGENANCEVVFLTVDPENSPAIRLYRSLGFEPTGERAADGQDVFRLELRAQSQRNHEK